MKKNLNSVMLCFLTVLSAGTLSNAQTLDYTFVTVGCNRIDPIDIVSAGVGSTYDTVSTANIGALNRIFTEVSALSPQPKFLFLTGDIVMGYRADTVYLANQLKGWKELYYAHPISKTGIKVVVVPGNHETQDKAAGKKSTAALERTFVREMKDFIIGNNGPMATGKVPGTDSLMTDQSQLTYSFDYKGDHFVIFNTDPTGRDSRIPFRWLKNDLQNAKARHIFSFGHKPAYSSLFKPKDGLEAFVAQRDSFWTVLENAHAEAMFAAHEHVWDTIQGHKGKTWQVIAGNGGSAVETTLNPVVNKKWNEAPYNYHGFTVVSVYSNNKVVCQSMGHDIGAHYFDEVPANPTTERANFRLETGVVIDHTPLVNTHQNGPFTVTATITDNISVMADTLMVWVNGVMSKSVAVVSGATYTYIIPAQIGSGVIEYSFKSVDNFGQVSWLPSDPNAKFKFSFGPNSPISSYVSPIANGVTLKSLLTVGDSVNGYKMAGLPDGLGAYDNNDGTFSLLMNHEIGNTLGVARAHGIKGAFVSKWVINKNDLTVVSGKDLIKSVYDWDAVNQVSKVDTSIHAFNRFCSADLPAPTAIYNSKTGKGTQEKVFMNGEESGNTGYAMAHVASGPNEGKSYVLGKFALSTNGSGLTGVGGWENILLCPFEQDITVAVGNNDGGTGIMSNSVVVYIGTKTTTGTEADKAGLTNGIMKFVNVAGNSVEIADATTRATNITSGTAFTLSGTASTTFSRPEDGAWDPKNPSHFYFVTTDRLDQVMDGIGTQIGRSRLWRLKFTDITNPNLGGTIDLLLDGTEGQVMFDNMTIDNFGHVLLLEDVGNNAHNGKVWQYSIAKDELKMIAMHDESRFGNIGKPASAPFNQDEETSGIIDMSAILGAGNFLLVDQAHYATTTELVEGGQLIKLFNPDTYAASQVPSGVTSSATPYIIPVKSGVEATAVLTVGDDVNGYKMAGIPDGLGAYDNNDGTFSLLMNHEHGNTVGVTRAHGIKGAFVSKWVINKNDLTVVSGKDLIKSVYDWDATNQVSKTDTSIHAFNRFCSADLPAPTALYNSKSGKGTQEKVFMNGEESGTTGYAMAHVASGPNEGKSYVLGKFALSTNGSGLTGVGGWENILLCPFEQDITVAVGNNDGGTGIMNNTVVVYVGTKTTTGTEADKAGLTNGTMQFVNVVGNAVEIADATTRATNITSGTAFTLSGTASTTFSRPEDGAWDPKNPSHFYFVTTDRLDQVMDGIGTQIGRSRLWRLKFTDITNPNLGGTIDLLLDGTEGQVMFDNMTIDNYGHVLLLEDVGNAPHNGKVWQYTIANDALVMLAKHDEARFGNIGVAATAPYNQDEETSGIIDMEHILGAGNFLLVDQAHYATTTELVEGGQLLKLFNPDTYNASQIITGFNDASDVSTTSAITLYPNPANNEATLSMMSEKGGRYVISVRDMKGNEALASVEKEFAKGQNNVTLNTSSLSNGIYFVQISNGSTTTRIKTVVLH